MRIDPNLIDLKVSKNLINDVISKNAPSDQTDEHSKEIINITVNTVFEILEKSDVINITE